MAAKTPSSIKEHVVGSNRLLACTFSGTAGIWDLDNADTWDSKISSVVAYWINPTDDPTQGKEKIDVKFQQNLFGTDNTARFTFYLGENSREGIMYVLAKI